MGDKVTDRSQEVILCRRCGRRLKTDEAKERGMGKICWEKAHTSPTIKPLFEVKKDVQN